MRVAAFGLFIVTLFVVAMWVGEDSMTMRRATAVIVIVIVMACIGALIAGSARWPIRIAAGVFVIVVVAGGLMLGSYADMRAYNQCIDAAPLLQKRIADFHQRAGRYPDRLSEVGDVPCSRFPRGTILHYVRTSSGYNLSYRDWLVRWDGSESMPITARK